MNPSVLPQRSCSCLAPDLINLKIPSTNTTAEEINEKKKMASKMTPTRYKLSEHRQKKKRNTVILGADQQRSISLYQRLIRHTRTLVTGYPSRMEK